MGKLRELAERIRQITPEAIESNLLSSLRANYNELIRLNQENLFEGLDSKGKAIRPPYASDSYANYKLKKNPLGVVDLKLTGAFYDGFFVQANQFPVFLGSADEKTFSLTQKYGKDIFGLDKTQITYVARTIALPRLQEYIIKAIRV